ncbi:alpha/beta hydrolase [Aureispira anguillae]|uniref:Alpha/beta hydrolase n=1 Tax=Aureispira anguillae TaxID=2864201 RepID=A0A915YIP0_9BACT|nr:alpha/beta hydrolase [Aureispira anguillae]BDS13717.1 alpha/beta hydrolase [Aureispira anguillae]
MNTTKYITKMFGLIFLIGGKRLLGIKKRADWPLKTELLWATTRLTLLSSNKYGLAWLKNLSKSYSPKPIFAEKVSIDAVDSKVGSYLKIAPIANAPQKLIIYFHGGGYVTGSPKAIVEFSSRLALKTAALVLTPFYPTAPEKTYPAAHQFASAFVQYVLTKYPNSTPFIAGDSAGAALALSAIKNLNCSLSKRLKGCILISPWVDPLAQKGSIQFNSKNDVGNREFVVACYHTYLNGAIPLEKYPLRFDAQNIPSLPPTFISIGDTEILLDQTKKLSEDIQTQGTQTTTMVYQGMFHTFWNMAPRLKEADRLIEDLANWMHKKN